MALLRKPTQPRSGNGGGFKKAPRETVAVIMTADPVRVDPKLPTPAEDYFVGTLLTEAFGKKAGEEVRVKVDVAAKARKRNAEKVAADQDGNKKALMEVVDLTFGKVKGGATMMANPTIILEKALYNAQTEFVEAEFLTVGTHSDTIDNERVETGVLVSVDRARKSNRESGGIYQTRYFYDRDNAAKVEWADPAASVDAVRQAVEQALEKASESEYKRPFVILQVVNKNPQPELPFGYEAVSAHIPLVYDRENKVSKSPSESFQEFFTAVATDKDGKVRPLMVNPVDKDGVVIEDKWVVAKDENGAVVPLLRNQEIADVLDSAFNEFEAGSKDYVVQVIPGYSFTTGADSLPSNGNGDAVAFLAPEEDEFTGEKKKWDGRFLAEGTVTLGRVKRVEREGTTLGEWFAKKTFTALSYDARLFRECEIVTQFTPPAVADVFNENAERRLAEKNERAKERRDARNNAAGQDQQPALESNYSGADDIQEEAQDDLSNGFGPGGR
ncbi:hypothetical protein [Rhizobium leguminosarum]|uniref:hypothetical protein n=1 Tax=Rhizobium leguminosarum TaxID=384 RepID=UPI002E0EBBBF|nr:hypothetical protein U8Q02_36305 [Rhizobium leguminosarum]